MSLNDELNNLTQSLRRTRTAIIGRGGDVSETAGFREIASAIYNIPDNAITKVTEDEVSTGYTVPENCTGYAYLAELGGMSYKSINLVNQEDFFAVKPSTKLDNGYWQMGSGAAGYTLFENTDGITGAISVSYNAKSLAEAVGDNAVFMVRFNYTDGTSANGARLYGKYTTYRTITDTSDASKTVSSITTRVQTAGDFEIKDIMVNFGEVKPYEPYFEGLRDTKVTEIVSKGANLLTPFVNITNTNGIKLTPSSDGTVLVNGTATSTVGYVSPWQGTNIGLGRGVIKLKVGTTYTLSGCPSGGTGTTYYLRLDEHLGGSSPKQSILDYGSGATFTAQYEEYSFNIRVFSGVTMDNLVFRPMLNEGTAVLPYTPYRAPISYPIPAEIQALLGEGISATYCNKADFENKKYKRVIETFVFDGSTDEKWYWNFNDGRSTDYFFIDYGASGIYVSGVLVCSHYDAVNFTAGDNEVGAWAANSSRGVFSIRIRPRSDMTGYTYEQWIAELKANPITIKFARIVPIESDLPVDFSPLVEVESGGTIEFVNEHGYAVPSKIIFHTLTQ